MAQSEDRIKQIVADMFGRKAEDLSGDMLLAQDLNIKSANRVNLSVQLEEAFDIDINIFEVLKLQTLQELFDLVDSKIAT